LKEITSVKYFKILIKAVPQSKHIKIKVKYNIVSMSNVVANVK
jgi:hypothetical protein